MDKILSLSCETHGYTIPPLNNMKMSFFSQMHHEYAPTMTKYLHYFQQQNLSIPTYSIVVTVTLQRKNALVIGILRRGGS
jgi:hypothetical protein